MRTAAAQTAKGSAVVLVLLVIAGSTAVSSTVPPAFPLHSVSSPDNDGSSAHHHHLHVHADATPAPSPSPEPSRFPSPYMMLDQEPENPLEPWVETAMLPVSTSPPILVSVITAMYKQVDDVLAHLERWGTTYDPDVLAVMEFIFVDDGSNSMRSSLDRIKAAIPPAVRVKFVSIDEDVGFNQGGACNTGALYATGQVFAFLDVDHWYTADVAATLVEFVRRSLDGGRLADGDYIYRLARRDWFFARNSTLYKERFGNSREKFNRWNLDRSSPNCILLNRDTFFQTGGYSECYSGAWGWVDLAFVRCCERLHIKVRDLTSINSTAVFAYFDSEDSTAVAKVTFGMNYELFKKRSQKKQICNNRPIARVPHSLLYSHVPK